MRDKMISFLACVLALALSGCAVSPPSPQNLDPLQAKEWLGKNPKTLLIDVRTPEEYRQEHIAGAKLIPIQELENRLAEIPKDKPLLLYCHSGRRSQKASDLLKDHGFKDVTQITGGITAWKEKGFPVETGVKPQDSPK